MPGIDEPSQKRNRAPEGLSGAAVSVAAAAIPPRDESGDAEGRKAGDGIDSRDSQPSKSNDSVVAAPNPVIEASRKADEAVNRAMQEIKGAISGFTGRTEYKFGDLTRALVDKCAQKLKSKEELDAEAMMEKRAVLLSLLEQGAQVQEEDVRSEIVLVLEACLKSFREALPVAWVNDPAEHVDTACTLLAYDSAPVVKAATQQFGKTVDKGKQTLVKCLAAEKQAFVSENEARATQKLEDWRKVTSEALSRAEGLQEALLKRIGEQEEAQQRGDERKLKQEKKAAEKAEKAAEKAEKAAEKAEEKDEKEEDEEEDDKKVDEKENAALGAARAGFKKGLKKGLKVLQNMAGLGEEAIDDAAAAAAAAKNKVGVDKVGMGTHIDPEVPMPAKKPPTGVAPSGGVVADIAEAAGTANPAGKPPAGVAPSGGVVADIAEAAGTANPAKQPPAGVAPSGGVVADVAEAAGTANPGKQPPAGVAPPGGVVADVAEAAGTAAVDGGVNKAPGGAAKRPGADIVEPKLVQNAKIVAAAGASAAVATGVEALTKHWKDREDNKVLMGRDQVPDLVDAALVPALQDAAVAGVASGGTAMVCVAAAEHTAFQAGGRLAVVGRNLGPIVGVSFCAVGVGSLLHDWRKGETTGVELRRGLTKVGWGLGTGLGCAALAGSATLGVAAAPAAAALGVGLLALDMSGATNSALDKIFGKGANQLRVLLVDEYAKVIGASPEGTDEEWREAFEATCLLIDPANAWGGTQDDLAAANLACARMFLLRQEKRSDGSA